MFHTFRGSPGSSSGNRLRVRLATGNSTSPPTATTSLYHKPTEKTNDEGTSTNAHKNIHTPDNSIKNSIIKVQFSNIHLRECPALRIGRCSGIGGGGQVHLSPLLSSTAATQNPFQAAAAKNSDSKKSLTHRST